MQPLEPLPRSQSLPLVGATFHYLRDPLGYLERASRLGDLVEMQMLTKQAWLVNDPGLIEQVLVKNASLFHKDMFMRELKRILGEGLLTSEGDFWKRQRRLIQPAFHRSHIAGYGVTMIDHTRKLVDGWQNEETLDIHQAMMELTAEIVTACLFGTNVGDASEVHACLEIIMERFTQPLFVLIPALDKLPLPSTRRFREVVPRLDRVVRGFIETRRALGPDAPSNDLLAMLLAARDEDGSAMSDQQVRDEALVLFLAGHETTALALSWTFFELAKHPDIERKLHEELDRVLGDRDPTLDDLARLEYTSQIVHESLRLHPPAWAMGRESAVPFEMNGRWFPRDAWIWITPWTVHRDPRWFPEPEAFRPERWADGYIKKLPKFAYFPFGGGPRICIGNQFAMMEAVFLLATVSRRFSLKLVPGQTIEPVPAITLRFAEGLKMKLQRRPSRPSTSGPTA